MKMKNTSNLPVKVRELGLVVQPGETVDLPDTIAKPGRYHQGARKAAIIEGLAPQLKPADENEHADWHGIPDAGEFQWTPEEGGPPSVRELMAQGHPQAVAEHMAARKREEWEAERLRKQAESMKGQYEAHLAEAAKHAAKEHEKREDHEKSAKEDEESSSKLAKEGQKKLKDEQEATKKQREAERKLAEAQRQQGRAGEVTLADVAGQTGTHGGAHQPHGGQHK